MSVENGVLSRAWYLAGPMSGIPHENIPAFRRASENLRYMGYKIVSPVELDDTESTKKVLADPTGKLVVGDITGETWGDFLARDVKLIADSVGGLIFLPGWHKSRGARLEAFIGILCGHSFGQYWERDETDECGVKTLSSQQVLMEVYNATS